MTKNWLPLSPGSSSSNLCSTLPESPAVSYLHDITYRDYAPDSISDPTIGGIHAEAPVLCRVHKLKPEMLVAFEGNMIGRRFYLCPIKNEVDNCGFVGWIDPEWQGGLKSCLDKLWAMFGDSEKRLIDSNHHNATLLHNVSEQKKKVDRKYTKLLEDMERLKKGRYKNERKPVVGVAHHVSFTRPYGLFDVAAVTLANSLTLFPFIDSICDKLDFIGINYYGQEVISEPGLKLVDNDEYSESGRGVYPDGLFRLLIQFNERYKNLNLPFIITENGVSDETDLIRKAYILEHLLAIYAAIIMGVRVLGYMFWTTSDNWEWADGYGPKFGLVAVDRANNLARKPRPSYYLFSKVVTTGKITRQDRAWAWRELQQAALQKETRPFFRAVDKHGRMYAGGLDRPIQRPFVFRDWRFGHYEMEGLQDPLSRILRSILSPISPNKKIHYIEDDAVSYSFSF